MSVTASFKLGIGLIGVGRHGSRYIKHLLHDMPDITLVALGRKRNDQDSGSLPAVPVYADYRALIADPKVQAIVVVTPPTMCHDICLAAIRASKPLLIEKPLAPTAEEARAMVSAANHAGILLMTAQTLRFDSTIEKVKELLPQIGALGTAHMTTHIELTSGTAVSGPGQRGALLEIGIHLLDAIRYLTSDEVRDVRCTMEPAPSTGPELRASVSLKTAHGTDIHLDIARVANGRVAHMTWIGS
ncbi:MAG TPA: Gfo/Idh/MocA family oxidoreductase, partial [Nitrospiraceae bacterium]